MAWAQADLIITGGRVYAADLSGRQAEAVAIKGDRVLALGTRQEVAEFRGPATEVVELQGQTVLPGLIDAHCHVIGLGLARAAIDLNYPRARSVADICRLVEERAHSQPPGTWVRGRGYDHLRLQERRHPTRWDLDPVSGDHPVLLVRSCGHMAVANSEALRRAGVTKETPDPPGGLIERREGEPTGVLKEAAMDLLDGVAVHTREEQEAALRLAAQEYLRLGVTAAQDMSGADAEGPAVLQDLVAGGRLGWRVCFSLIGLPPSGGRAGAGNRVLEAGIHTGLGDHWIRLGPCKALLDGSDDGATAAMYRPYRDGSGTGISYWQDEELREWATAAAAHGWQVALHAIGDRAIDQAISALSAATAAATSTAAPDTAVTAGAGAAAGAAGEGRTAGVKGRAWRHRIEHCLYPTPEAVATIISCRFVPVVQPIFLSMMDEGYLNLVDPETLRLGFPVRTFLRAGLPVAAGSDAPVADPNPLAGMAEAIDRATAGGIPFRPEEAVSLEEAIAMYTRHAAWAAHWEEALGSLEPGKLADLVVLTEDIFSLPPHELRQVRVYLTVVGGRIVYSSSR